MAPAYSIRKGRGITAQIAVPFSLSILGTDPYVRVAAMILVSELGEVRAISWKAQNRLHQRFMRLSARRLQRNKALVAIARELCGFIWELLRMQRCYQTPH